MAEVLSQHTSKDQQIHFIESAGRAWRAAKARDDSPDVVAAARSRLIDAGIALLATLVMP